MNKTNFAFIDISRLVQLCNCAIVQLCIGGENNKFEATSVMHTFIAEFENYSECGLQTVASTSCAQGSTIIR